MAQRAEREVFPTSGPVQGRPQGGKKVKKERVKTQRMRNPKMRNPNWSHRKYIFEKPPKCFSSSFPDYYYWSLSIPKFSSTIPLFFLLFFKNTFHLNTAYIPAFQHVGMYSHFNLFWLKTCPIYVICPSYVMIRYFDFWFLFWFLILIFYWSRWV